MTRHVLLVDCLDRPGLVHAITGILLQHGSNVLGNHEFVDHDGGRFFMRTEFIAESSSDVSAPSLSDRSGLDQARLIRELEAALPAGASVQLTGQRRPRMVVLVTKEHHCLGELLMRHAFNELGGELTAVIGNYGVLRPLVEKFAIPYHEVSHEGLSREQHEQAMFELVEQYQPDYVVLAKYMRVLSPAVVARYPYRLINIHHSFLPAFVGASPYRQAWQRGVKIIGATGHFVTDDLDEGPIIAQSVIPVDHSHGPDDMAQAGRDVEKSVLAKTLKLVLEHRVMLSGNRTIIFE